MTSPAAADGWMLRPSRTGDLDAVYEIAHRTGMAGGDATGAIDDRRLVGELWAAPYVLLEPDHAFVLDDGTGVAVGYVLGTVDAEGFEERCEREWWPALRERYPLRPDGDSLDDLLVALLHHRWPPEPDVSGPFPSELHIDLLPIAQGRGWGRRMIATVLGSLRAAGSKGVHLGTAAANTRAIGFYEHLGFERLPRPVDGGGADTVTFGMRLDRTVPLIDDAAPEAT